MDLIVKTPRQSNISLPYIWAFLVFSLRVYSFFLVLSYIWKVFNHFFISKYLSIDISSHHSHAAKYIQSCSPYFHFIKVIITRRVSTMCQMLHNSFIKLSSFNQVARLVLWTNMPNTIHTQGLYLSYHAAFYPSLYFHGLLFHFIFVRILLTTLFKLIPFPTSRHSIFTQLYILYSKTSLSDTIYIHNI